MSIIDEIRQRVPDSWWNVHGPAIEAVIAKVETAHAKERADMTALLCEKMAVCGRRWDMIHHMAQYLPRAVPQCLGVNKDGSPKHPLYVAADKQLVEWRCP